MGFLSMVEGVEAVEAGSRGEAKPKLGIFDSSKQRVLEDLAISIEEAKGRFHGEGDGALEKAKASRCWRVQYVPVYEGKKRVGSKLRTHPDNGDELVTIYIKCKGSILDGLLEDHKGNEQKTLKIAQRDVVSHLEKYQGLLEVMEQGTPLGDYWHDNAVHNSLPPSQRGETDKWGKMIGKDGFPKYVSHCAETDSWVKKDKVAKKSPYPTRTY